MPKPIINLDEIRYAPRPPDFAPKGDLANRFEMSTGPVSRLIGGEKLGYNVTVIPPGKAAYPFHAHRFNEEMFFVLEGSGELRLGLEVHPIRSGDFIACPPGGPEAAHQIRNTGGEDLKFLAVSTMLSPELNEYPDSRKFGFYADLPAGGEGEVEYFSFQAREDTSLDYWDGED